MQLSNPKQPAHKLYKEIFSIRELNPVLSSAYPHNVFLNAGKLSLYFDDKVGFYPEQYTVDIEFSQCDQATAYLGNNTYNTVKISDSRDPLAEENQLNPNTRDFVASSTNLPQCYLYEKGRGYITFYIGSNVPSVPLTIKKVKFNWQGNNRIDEVDRVYDDTIDQYWLDSGGGPYLEDVEYDVVSAQGGVNITDVIDHHLTLSLDYGDRPTNTIFTVSFYIESSAFTGWEVFVLYF